MSDAEGRPLRFILTGGEPHDVTTAADLLDGYTADGVIADKAYDTNALREIIDDAGADALIPSKRNRKVHTPHRKKAHRLRNRIERIFNKLNIFAASLLATIAERYTSWPPCNSQAA